MTERWNLGDRTAVYGEVTGYLFRLPSRELADQVISDHNAVIAASTGQNITSAPVEVRTETERDPGPCSSVSPDGRYRCRNDDGHKPRHEAWTGTSLLRWNDQEASRG